MQALTPSNVVRHTSNLPGYRWFLRMSSRSALVAIKFKQRIYGHHFLNSCFQLGITALGTTTMK